MAFQKKDINGKIKLLNETLLNIFNGFIPNKIFKFDYKKPVWMNKEIKLLLKKRLKLTKKYCNNPSDHNKNLLVNVANECTRLIIAAKEKYLIRLSAKIEDPSTASKTYQSILNRFLSNKKIPIKQPIFVNEKVVSNFTEKGELFNAYFASQCTPLINKSQLPSLEFKANKSKRLEKMTFTDDNINLIKNLNVDEAHEWGNIYIQMIKL